ncbi:hypothetical protein GLW20_02275 [Virgibacillus halodenitrificans]|nr:hypothetical protein [Virgibacillus halodenitrificans]
MRKAVISVFILVYALMPFIEVESDTVEVCNINTKQLCEYNLEKQVFINCEDIQCKESQ